MVEVIDMRTGQLSLFPVNQDQNCTVGKQVLEGVSGSFSVTLPVTHLPYLKVTTLTGIGCVLQQNATCWRVPEPLAVCIPKSMLVPDSKGFVIRMPGPTLTASPRIAWSILAA